MRRILFITLILLQLGITTARAEVMVIVRRQAEAAGNYVRICDIARVEGPKDQALVVAKTVLGPTPPKGQTREITRWDIENRLFEMGVDATVTFTGNDMVKVTGGATHRGFPDPDEVELQRLEPMTRQPYGRIDALSLGDGESGRLAALNSPVAKSGPTLPVARESSSALMAGMGKEAVDNLGKVVSNYLSGRYQRADIEVEAKLLNVSEAVPYGAHEIKVEEAISGRVPGKATLRLTLKETADAEPKEVIVAADTEVFGLALVAKRPLVRGDVLAKGDVRIDRVRMDSGKSYLPPNPRAAEGRQMTGDLAQGAALLVAQAVPTEAVKRGDIVESVTGGQGWEIRGNAKALSSGMVGDTIKVEDTGTKAKYNARIIGRGRVSAKPKDWRTEK